MGLEMPDELKWLTWLVGESWPEGDEDKLRMLRDAWTQTGQAIPDVLGTGNAAAREVLGSWQGESADAFERQWKNLTEGEQAAFGQIQQMCEQLAQSCDQTALDVEYTKYMIIASLVLLAIQIAAMIAAAFVSAGASTAAIVPAQLATRAAVQMVFRQLVQKLLQQGAKQVAKEALEKVLKEALEKFGKQGMKNLAGMAAKNAGAQVALDAGIQGAQVAAGDRKSWDWDKTTGAAASGAGEGLAGHLVNGPGAGAGSVLGHAARGGAEGALGSVAGAAATGDLGSLSAGEVFSGAMAGSADGGVGGAKAGFSGAADAASARQAADAADSVRGADSGGAGAGGSHTGGSGPGDSGGADGSGGLDRSGGADGSGGAVGSGGAAGADASSGGSGDSGGSGSSNGAGGSGGADGSGGAVGSGGAAGADASSGASRDSGGSGNAGIAANSGDSTGAGSGTAASGGSGETGNPANAADSGAQSGSSPVGGEQGGGSGGRGSVAAAGSSGAAVSDAPAATAASSAAAPDVPEGAYGSGPPGMGGMPPAAAHHPGNQGGGQGPPGQSGPGAPPGGVPAGGAPAGGAPAANGGFAAPAGRGGPYAQPSPGNPQSSTMDSPGRSAPPQHGGFRGAPGFPQGQNAGNPNANPAHPSPGQFNGPANRPGAPAGPAQSPGAPAGPHPGAPQGRPGMPGGPNPPGNPGHPNAPVPQNSPAAQNFPAPQNSPAARRDPNQAMPGGGPHPGTPQDGQHGRGMPQGAQPDRGMPQGGQPDRGMPQSGQPGRGAPPGGQPHRGAPQGGQPDRGAAPGGAANPNHAQHGGQPNQFPPGPPPNNSAQNFAAPNTPPRPQPNPGQGPPQGGFAPPSGFPQQGPPNPHGRAGGPQPPSAFQQGSPQQTPPQQTPPQQTPPQQTPPQQTPPQQSRPQHPGQPNSARPGSAQQGKNDLGHAQQGRPQQPAPQPSHGPRGSGSPPQQPGQQPPGYQQPRQQQQPGSPQQLDPPQQPGSQQPGSQQLAQQQAGPERSAAEATTTHEPTQPGGQNRPPADHHAQLPEHTPQTERSPAAEKPHPAEQPHTEVPRTDESTSDTSDDTSRDSAPARDAQHQDDTPDQPRHDDSTAAQEDSAPESTHESPEHTEQHHDSSENSGEAEAANRLSKDDLDFCFDPDYRAPADSFQALEDKIAEKADWNHAERKVCTRLDVLRDRVQGKLPELDGVSARGALAAHSYTAHDVFPALNHGCRVGELSASQLGQVQAIVSGLNELSRHQGSVVRGIDFPNPEAAARAAAHYEPGRVTVETSITSLSMKTDGNDRPAIEGNVELHVESTEARRLQELASNPSEREVVLLPSSQLMVHSKELVPYEARDGSTKHKWVIHAEEIASGDPRHLGQDQAKQLMVERQELARQQEAEITAGNDFDSILNPEGSPQDRAADSQPPDGPATSDLHLPTETAATTPDVPQQADASSVVDDGGPAPRTDSATEVPGTDPGPSKFERMLAPDDTPFSGHPADPFGPDESFGSAGPPLDADGNPDWHQLERSTPPVTNLPAIHNGTAAPDQHTAYVDQRHPELRAVNPNFDHPNAYENGTKTNCTRCVVSYAQRLIGIDAQAEPVLPNELKTKGTLPWVQQQLGGAWESHGSYDDVIGRMSQQPLGSHAVIGVQFATPDGVLGHVAMVTNTPEGVAFIDPQSGTLMQLPHPPLGLHLLPFGSLHPEVPDVGSGHSRDRIDGDAEKSAEPQESVDASHPDSADEIPEPPADGAQRRPNGPWFGQHTNPFRPTVEEEEPPPAFPPAGAAHYGSAAGEPGAGRLDAEEPGTPTPAVPREPQLPLGDNSNEPPQFPGVPPSNGNTDLARPGGMNKSMSGTLESGIAPQEPSGQAGIDTGGTASSGVPDGFTGPAADAQAGGASSTPGPADHPTAATPAPSTEAPGAGTGGAGAQPPATGSAAPGAGAAGRTAGERAAWRAGAAPEITHNREQVIPGDLAVRYLCNHESGPILTGDGRQLMFRGNAVPSQAIPDDAEFADAQVKMHFTAPAQGDRAIVDPDSVNFAGAAEIVVQDAAGVERVLGTFDASSQSWTPTDAGRRWLQDSDGRAAGDDVGRTR